MKAGFENAFKVIDPAQLDSKIGAIKSKMAELQDVIANPMAHRSITGATRSGPIYSMPDEAQATAQLRLAQDIDKRLEAEKTAHVAKMKEIGAEVGKADQNEADKALQAAQRAARAAEEVARKNQELVAQVVRSNEQIANQAREISNQQIEYQSRLKKEA